MIKGTEGRADLVMKSRIRTGCDRGSSKEPQMVVVEAHADRERNQPIRCWASLGSQ